MTWRTGLQLIKNKLWNCGFSVYVGFFLRTCIVKDVTMTVSSSVRWWLRKKNQLFAVFILNSFEQFKILLHLQNMTVLNKFFVLRGVKFPAHGRVGEFRCGSVRSSIHETQHQKKFRIALFDIGTLRGRSSEVVKTMSRRSVDLFCLQEIRWKSDGVMHLVVW